jgi:hypothetical protein
MIVFDNVESLTAKVRHFQRVLQQLENVLLLTFKFPVILHLNIKTWFQMDWVNSFAIGVHLQDTYADDQINVCGCGTLPFITTIAQLLKSNDCDPLPCF